MAVRLKDRIEANIRQSDKVNSSLSILLNSGTATVYDGSAGKSINITPAAIGAVKKSGDTLTLAGNLYEDSYSAGALHLANSNIDGINAIYFCDAANVPSEAIHFYRSATTTDTIWAYNGVLYFIPNRTLGSENNVTAYTVLHSNNYTSYTVTKTGSGASGTWGINITGTATALTTSAGSSTLPVYFSNGKPVATGTSLAVSITGNAATATKVNNYYGNSRPTSIAPGVIGDGSMFHFKCTSSVTDTTTDPGDAHILHFNWDNTGGYDFLIAGLTTQSTLKYRGMSTGTWNDWVTSIDTGNYTTYCAKASHTHSYLPLSGGTVTGTTTILNIRFFNDTVTSGTSAGSRSVLAIMGTTYGNDSAYLKTAGKLSFGDPGPQIQFISGTNPASGQRAALIYTDHDTIGTGNSLSLVSTETSCRFIAPQVWGAVWNDYAEFRGQNEPLTAGYIAYCDDDGKLKYTTERLQKFEGVISDTFGFAIGETDECKTPLAVSGRALVYCDPEDHFHSGDCVCAGPDGKAYRMTREEVTMYPDRIVGVVSEIPTYERWGTGNVEVNGRIWIKVK